MNANDTLIPHIGVVTDIRIDTPDVKTFRVNAISADGTVGGKVFEHMPGQCAMLSIPGVGEAMFSITSSPTNKDLWNSAQKMRLPYKLASRYGRWTADHYKRTLR